MSDERRQLGLSSYHSSLITTPVLRRVVDDFDGAAADSARVEGDGAVAVLLEGSALAARGLLKLLARLDAQADVLRVFGFGRQQRHAEAARVAQHRPVLVHGLHAEAHALVLAHVRREVFRLDRDVVYDPAETRLACCLSQVPPPSFETRGMD